GALGTAGSASPRQVCRSDAMGGVGVALARRADVRQRAVGGGSSAAGLGGLGWLDLADQWRYPGRRLCAAHRRAGVAGGSRIAASLAALAGAAGGDQLLQLPHS